MNNKPLRTKPRTSSHGRAPTARSGGAARSSEPAPRSQSADSRLLRSDSDDHLSTYFRDLAEHELLGPEQERELSQGIEDQEILTWERVLARADIGPEVLAMIEGKLEEPLKPQKYLKAVESVAVPVGCRLLCTDDVRRTRRVVETVAALLEAQRRPVDGP